MPTGEHNGDRPAQPEGAGPGSITRLVNRIGAGELASRDPRFPIVYDELRKQAGAVIRRRGDRWRLHTTELVHAAYIKLFGVGEARWESRRHFYGSAARAMEQVLVELARRRRPRPGGMAEELAALAGPAPGEPREPVAGGKPLDVVAVSEALRALDEQDGHLAEIVRLRVFAGLTMDEIAEMLDVPPRTLDRQWVLARAWLVRRMVG